MQVAGHPRAMGVDLEVAADGQKAPAARRCNARLACAVLGLVGTALLSASVVSLIVAQSELEAAEMLRNGTALLQLGDDASVVGEITFPAAASTTSLHGVEIKGASCELGTPGVQVGCPPGSPYPRPAVPGSAPPRPEGN